MVRFGKIISISRVSQFAIIRENTPHGREFLVMKDELQQLPVVSKFDQVTFEKDPDYKSTDVATLIKVHSRDNAA